MRLIGRLLFSVFSNALAILGAGYFIKGFIFTGNFLDLLTAAGIFTLINTFIRPVMKLLFGPLIVLTFGLFIFVINALTIFLLDFFSDTIIIEGLIPLLYSTVAMGAVNIIINFSAKSLFKSQT